MKIFLIYSYYHKKPQICNHMSFLPNAKYSNPVIHLFKQEQWKASVNSESKTSGKLVILDLSWSNKAEIAEILPIRLVQYSESIGKHGKSPNLFNGTDNRLVFSSGLVNETDQTCNSCMHSQNHFQCFESMKKVQYSTNLIKNNDHLPRFFS